MRIYELVIEPGREDHIARHHVSVAEVEEVIFEAPFVRKARQGRYHIIGRTQADISQYLLLHGDRVCMAWLQPEMQMMRSAEHTCAIASRDTYDKQRSRTTKGY